jgi:hypothetical protein
MKHELYEEKNAAEFLNVTYRMLWIYCKHFGSIYFWWVSKYNIGM